MALFVLDTFCVRGSTFTKGIEYTRSLSDSSSAVAIATGAATFAIQSGLSLTPGQRVRAFSANPDDPNQFVEGTVTSYSGTALVLNIDLIGGDEGSTFNSWHVVGMVDLTGGTFDATMKLDPETCAGRVRTPVTMSVQVVAPLTGIFTLYLSPTQTAALTLGKYVFNVLFTPAASSDKLLVLSGTITVVDSLPDNA